MGKFSRPFLKNRVGASGGMPALSGAADAALLEGSSRRAFLQGTAGAAAGARWHSMPPARAWRLSPRAWSQAPRGRRPTSP
jgi:hypothetical protein